MSLENLIYDILMLSCWAYALLRGGAPERIGATVLVAGSYLSLYAFSGLPGGFTSLEAGVFRVDIAVFIAFLILALFAERFWPMWVASLQAMGTAGHLVKVVDPTIVPWAYAIVLLIWSYPIILLMVLGTWRHQKRLARFGADKSWSTFHW